MIIPLDKGTVIGTDFGRVILFFVFGIVAGFISSVDVSTISAVSSTNIVHIFLFHSLLFVIFCVLFPVIGSPRVTLPRDTKFHRFFMLILIFIIVIDY